MVCNKKIDSHKKMIVFNERYVPVGFSCKYCNSIYDEDDILVDLGNPDKLDLYGET
jgi:aspartate carbamoyltransferase regulatory subunit